MQAFEHILTDQQASLVKELEHQVLKCVKDQNGNHVVQKAIERIPADHIHFIINAFTGQVHGLATHPYGCRVVQRMLEHCRDPSRKQLLEELHACALSLIVDQYGNYVTQHVIEHGDLQDRLKIINLITAQLLMFSKHKFASNVVEKSIQCSTDEQRHKIVSMLTNFDDRGESPLVHLIKDQYGNYVIRELPFFRKLLFLISTQKNFSSNFEVLSSTTSLIRSDHNSSWSNASRMANKLELLRSSCTNSRTQYHTLKTFRMCPRSWTVLRLLLRHSSRKMLNHPKAARSLALTPAQ